MGLIGFLIDLIFNIVYFIIIAQVALHWLAIFGVVNTNNEQAAGLIEKLNAITEPVYSKIRQFILPIGGIDLTPLITLIGVSFVHYILKAIIG